MVSDERMFTAPLRWLDAADLGEHAIWATLKDPIYRDDELEIFRPELQESTLPVYYAKGRLPCEADTLFNALFDARYRQSWDARVTKLQVVERMPETEVMYAACSLPWPFSNRDYVFLRRTHYFARQQAFVVIFQSMHHASAPECNGLVRVETCSLRLCIRTTGLQRCDFHVEYEDDTNFSIPNYLVNWLLSFSMPTFMQELRKACANYADYAKTLDDNDVQGIPSQVVRRRGAKPQQQSLPVQVAANKDPLSRLKQHRRSISFDQAMPAKSAGSDVASDASVNSVPERRTRKLLSRRRLKKATSELFRKSSSVSIDSAANDASDDDFTIVFHKQKIGLHLETELFSNKVLVALCEKESEAAKSSVHIEPGMLVTSVNGVNVANMSFSQVLGEMKKSSRPLTLGFRHADEQSSKMYRRFKQPTNFIKCVVTRNDHDLVRSLRPLHEDTSVSAVLKLEFRAPAYTKQNMRTSSSRTASSSSRTSSIVAWTDTVTIPEGFVVYEIDDCYVMDVPFVEIVHFLRKNNQPRAVTFKAAVAVNGVQDHNAERRSTLSKRLSEAFKWRSFSLDDFGAPTENDDARASKSRQAQVVQPAIKAQRIVSKSPYSASKDAATSSDTNWHSQSNPGSCLSDYSDVVITNENIQWAWQHVHLLKADERIFSAALLVEKLEMYLMKPDHVESSVTKTVLNEMSQQRELLNNLKERNRSGLHALQDFQQEDDGDWQFGQLYFGVTTHWKPGNDGTIWLKLDGIVDGVDIFNTVAVVRETDMYSVWAPFCSQSLLLQQIGRVELVGYMCFSFPLLQRDVVIKAFGINACYESRCVLLLGASADERKLPASVQVPKLKGWNADRMDLRGFRALIEPISSNKTRICIVSNFDPKCAVPKSMLNLGIKKLAGILLFLIRKEAEKIEKAKQDGTENEHLQRIESDPSQFYSWLRPLIAQWLSDLESDNLPPRLDIQKLTKSTVAATPTAKGCRSDPPLQPISSRTTAFHHQLPPQSDNINAIAPKVRRRITDYLYDFGIWPCVLLGVFTRMITPEVPFLVVCGFKLVFTCACTWFGVPGAFSWRTRQIKRAQKELNPLRRRCVVLAALLDVLNSYALRIWANWLICYTMVLHWTGGDDRVDLCFERSPLEVRESENFWLLVSCFVLASMVVGVQIVVNI